MPIAPELNTFANEDKFTKKFLIPLLQRLGFSVVFYHGTREFGRDLIFAEIDKFGHVLYHGLQSKFVGSISLNESHDLIRDCEQAFAVQFTHPQTGQQHYISSFYAVNGGSIPDQSREHIFSRLLPKFGANVMLFDGPGIVALDRLSMAGQSANVAQQLKGMLWELHLNNLVFTQIKPTLEAIGNLSDAVPLQRLYTQATSALVINPPFSSPTLAVKLMQLAENLRRINYLLDSVDGTDNIHYLTSRVAEALRLIPETFNYNVEVRKLALDILHDMGATVNL